MKPTKAQSIAKLAQWCVENSSETFSAFFYWSMPCAEVVVYKGGRFNPHGGEPVTFELDLEDHFCGEVEEWAGDTITELNTLLMESNEHNKNLQSRRYAIELEQAKAVIARLESNE